MRLLAVQIVRFLDDHQPGWVECEFVDAEGRKHTILEKVPVVSFDDLERNSNYPCGGVVPCTTIAQWQDEKSRKLARISTADPAAIESKEGLSEFVVLAEQLSA
ncbi:MAG TPA: hypothetical protein VN025_10015 [Candidatus Dormibacteraeota bacterium]|jgi:hypothetical protein|nr:hypothetical protein [Candidatus Dormibacteraeota bacterium]